TETPSDEENTGNVECNRTESQPSDQASLQGPVALFSLLSVRIIRMTNLREADLLSQSDCYVSLRLPSSSFVTARTKTISNCTNPVWNETFFFRIQNMAKNILEITIYDEDSPFNDEELCRVTFDIANLQLEERVCKHFELNEESRELCCLKVEVNHRERKKKRKSSSSGFDDYSRGSKINDSHVWEPIRPPETQSLALYFIHHWFIWHNVNLEGMIMDVRKQVMKNKLCCFSGENLKYYEKEIWNRHDEGYKLTFADLWGLILESMFHDEPDPHKLSDQRQAINLEWVEFTPYEVGFLKYGAFINAEDFGSEFYMGHLMKKIPESRLCFMQGMWSNIYSQSLLDALYLAECSEDFWHRWTRPRMYEIEDDIPPWLPKRPYVQPTRLFIPNGSVSDVIRDVVTVRPVVACYSNFIKGLQFNNKYLENNSFSMWKDTVLDCSPNHLTESEEYLELVDTAFFINTSCPPLLRPERQVDIIIHLNYSGGSQTLPLDLSTRYYHDQGIPFPKAVLTEEDKKQLKECYLFDDAESPKAPILLYFPLVCDTFQKYKSPGIERSPNEMDDGYADVTSTIFSPYATGILQYSEEDFNKLINLTNYNILNNEHMILQALRTAVERKKQQNFYLYYI
ncbi:Cytosolic phospholipase A2 epsilon, partial [Ophiophagus hannah]